LTWIFQFQIKTVVRLSLLPMSGTTAAFSLLGVAGDPLPPVTKLVVTPRPNAYAAIRYVQKVFSLIGRHVRA